MNTGRRIWTLAAAGVMALAITFVLSSTAVSKKPPATIVIKACQKKKTPTKFPHKAHVKKLKAHGVKCKTCHHKKSKVKTCSSAKCHAKAQKNIGTCFDKSKKKNPFHKQCIGCHKKMGGKKGLKKGPVKCKGCHPKK
jgi:hypothetical protein